MKKKVYRTKIHPHIKKLAKKYGLDIRIGADPESVDIIRDPDQPEDMLAFHVIGTPVIFVKDKTFYRPSKMNLVLLHEISHAILGFYPLGGSGKVHEVMANAGSIILATELGLKVPDYIIDHYNQFVEVKKKPMNEKTAVSKKSLNQKILNKIVKEAQTILSRENKKAEPRETPALRELASMVLYLVDEIKFRQDNDYVIVK